MILSPKLFDAIGIRLETVEAPTQRWKAIFFDIARARKPFRGEMVDKW